MEHKDTRSITESDLERMLLDEAAEPRALPFSLLEKITDHFSYKREIGRGGFAVVYEGRLRNGVVAVKRLHNTHMYENQFIREVECLMKVKHKNVVRFLGYCFDTQGNMERYNKKMVMAEKQERLLCFEYVPNGSLDGYIRGASGGLEWTKSYQIIKGICEGLHFLHHINIWHLDLKPSNILMDENWIPKITDFGLSRSFEELQTRVVPTKMLGTPGYLAPEFTENVITRKFDLYSLGVTILQMLSRGNERHTIENILEIWGKRLELSQGNTQLEQIRACAEIATKCTNFDPAMRPASMKHVMDRLAETEKWQICTSELHPLEHRFYLHELPCSLHLTNKTDEHVAFRIMERSSDSLRFNYSFYPLYGVVPPRSSCTLIMTTKEKRPAETPDIDLVLQSSTISRDRMSWGILEDKSACNIFFKEAKELGHAVYEVALKASPPGEATSSEAAVRPTIVIEPFDKSLRSLDAHPTEPWIVIGTSYGSIIVWNHESKTTMWSSKISQSQVPCVKFHATKKWIVAATLDYFVHVYDCACVTRIQKITSFEIGTHIFAIHPTKSYLLSNRMELWDSDKGWQCTRKLSTKGYCKFAFNPEDPNILAWTNMGGNHVKVSSLDSPTPDYTLRGHSRTMTCLAFFKHGDRQCLITGSDDFTAKIWDLQTKACIHTMDVFMSPLKYVISIPGRPYLVTCTAYATIHVWSSIDFSLKTTINFIGGGEVEGLVCLMGSRSIAIGQFNSISIMDINNDEEVVLSERNSVDSECATGESSNS